MISARAFQTHWNAFNNAEFIIIVIIIIVIVIIIIIIIKFSF
jgi:hypothetical protein